MADIDIDVQSTFSPEDYFSIIPASMEKDGVLKRHPVGVYFQNMPTDPITKLAAIPYKHALDLGYFKIDMLHLSVLDNFTNKQQIRELLNKEPNWDLLQNEDIVLKLFQISKHYDLLTILKPKSVLELADCIALIRPGKRYLVNDYLRDKYTIRKTKLYKKEQNSDYKKSHAVAYATVIVLQLHLIEQTTIIL